MNTVERPHHPYSPSSLQNLEACPCFLNHSNKANERSIAGTLAHKVVESRSDNAKLSDEDAELAAECADFFERRRQIMIEAREREIERLAAAFNDHPDSFSLEVPQIEEFSETYLPIDDCKFVDAESTTAGYIDNALIDHTQTYAEVFDYKFGRWPVEHAEDNLQGWSYTLGMLRRRPKLTRVRFFFHQPGIDSLTSAEFTRDQIPAMYLRIQAVVARARVARKLMEIGDFSMANPMVPVCNFCANLGRCTKVLDIACKVGSKFYPLEIPANITPTMVLDRHSTSLAMRLSQVLKVWADAFRAQTTDRVLRQACDMPDGFTLESRSEREVINADEYRKVALQYLTEDEYKSCLQAPTFGSIEDLIKEKSPRGQKKAALEQFKQSLEAAGAVKRSDPYCFLKAIPQKKENEQ
jgi:hypothetical protein